MLSYDQVFENNRAWVAERLAEDGDFFEELARGQDPLMLYIGCSDSRVTAEEIMGAGPGEVFVHRNIGNLVGANDLNSMSVITYAIEHLHVEHVIVCGHYGCGGVKSAMQAEDLGLLNPWLRNIRDVYRMYEEELDALDDPEARYDRLIERNVHEQCLNVVKTASLQRSFLRYGIPRVHGWVFDMRTGALIDLEIDMEKMLEGIRRIYDLGVHEQGGQ